MSDHASYDGRYIYAELVAAATLIFLLVFLVVSLCHFCNMIHVHFKSRRHQASGLPVKLEQGTIRSQMAYPSLASSKTLNQNSSHFKCKCLHFILFLFGCFSCAPFVLCRNYCCSKSVSLFVCKVKDVGHFELFVRMFFLNLCRLRSFCATIRLKWLPDLESDKHQKQSQRLKFGSLIYVGRSNQAVSRIVSADFSDLTCLGNSNRFGHTRRKKERKRVSIDLNRRLEPAHVAFKLIQTKQIERFKSNLISTNGRQSEY